MTQLKRNKPIIKPNYLKIMLRATLGIWFIIPIILLKPMKNKKKKNPKSWEMVMVFSPCHS